MSNNPYAPPDSELSNTPEESIRRRFPLWTVGPLPWVAAAILAIVINILSGLFRFWRPPPYEVLGIMGISALVASVVAGVYGLIYGLILSRICRALYVTPRPKPHFCTIQAIVVIGNFIQFSGLTTFFFATLAGGLMAIFNFQEKAGTELR